MTRKFLQNIPTQLYLAEPLANVYNVQLSDQEYNEIPCLYSPSTLDESHCWKKKKKRFRKIRNITKAQQAASNNKAMILIFNIKNLKAFKDLQTSLVQDLKFLTQKSVIIFKK